MQGMQGMFIDSTHFDFAYSLYSNFVCSLLSLYELGCCANAWNQIRNGKRNMILSNRSPKTIQRFNIYDQFYRRSPTLM